MERCDESDRLQRGCSGSRPDCHAARRKGGESVDLDVEAGRAVVARAADAASGIGAACAADACRASRAAIRVGVVGCRGSCGTRETRAGSATAAAARSAVATFAAIATFAAGAAVVAMRAAIAAHAAGLSLRTIAAFATIAASTDLHGVFGDDDFPGSRENTEASAATLTASSAIAAFATATTASAATTGIGIAGEGVRATTAAATTAAAIGKSGIEAIATIRRQIEVTHDAAQIAAALAGHSLDRILAILTRATLHARLIDDRCAAIRLRPSSAGRSAETCRAHKTGGRIVSAIAAFAARRITRRGNATSAARIAFDASLTGVSIGRLRLRLCGAVRARRAIRSIANGHRVVPDVQRSYAATETHAIGAFAITDGRCCFDGDAFDMRFLIDLRRVKHGARGFYRRRHIGRAPEFEIGILVVESAINADSRNHVHGFVVDFTGQTDRGNTSHLRALNRARNGLHRVITRAIAHVVAHARRNINTIFDDSVRAIAVVVFVLIIDGIARADRRTGIFTTTLTRQWIAIDVVRVRHTAIHARIDHSRAR